MLAALSVSFTAMADDSSVLASDQKTQVATALEDDAQVMSNTKLEEQLVDEPPAVRAEIVRINTDARPLALQIALIVPILAALLGLLTTIRTARLPDPVADHPVEGAFG